MNQIILLACDTFVSKMFLRQPGFIYRPIAFIDHLHKTKREYKNLKRYNM